MQPTTLSAFIDTLAQTLRDGQLVKLTLSGYRGAEPGLQKILARPVLVKKQPKLSVTYRYKTRDIVKNYDAAESARQVQEMLADFTVAQLFTTQADVKLEHGKLKRSAPTHTQPPAPEHNRAKHHLIGSARPYLHSLGITNATGQVLASAQDKFRQINKYVEIVGALVGKLHDNKGLRIADMGAGKGYLTFALYDHLATAGLAPQVTGVEFRADLVKLCNAAAQQHGMDGLRFTQGTIDGFDATGTDLLIALHACDTATDDAIAKGIRAQAALIVVAPCCHKQVRRAMEASSAAPSLDFLLRHGSFMERQAEMVTDGLRALLLELHGYKTQVFEFISDAHTAKNMMITATRGPLPTAQRQQAIREEIRAAKQLFGVSEPYLETLLG